MKQFVIVALLCGLIGGLVGCEKPTPPPETTKPAVKADASTPAPAAEPEAAAAAEPVADPTFELRKFDEADVPASLVEKGTVQHGLRFTDANGDNLVVFWGVEDSQDIFAAHVLLADGEVSKLLREVKQLRGDCEFDYSAAFVGGAIGVTDLDADDRGEVTFAYKYACRSDLSAQDYKLVVLEDGEKAILRGLEIMIMAGEEPYGTGKFEAEGFAPSSKVLEHATKVWKQHVITRY